MSTHPTSWRAGQPDSSPRPPAADAGQGWRRDRAAPTRSFRRAKLMAALVGALALGGFFFWATTWLQPPRPSVVILVGAGYQENLLVPHNVPGWNGLQDLARLVGTEQERFWGRRQMSLPREPLQLRRGAAWDQGLDDDPEATLLLYFSVQGGADEGGAYLLPQDAGAGPEQENRLRLTAVLDRLEKLSPARNKVLVLDAARVIAHWPLGMLHNDFVGSLLELDGRIRSIPNLVVISSTDVDQRSWDYPQVGRTAFGHFLVEGLKGLAWTPQNEGRITAWELYARVKESVGRWVAANRGVRQTPVLLPTGPAGEERARRIDLAIVPKGYRGIDPSSLPAFSTPPELLQLWQDHRDLAGQNPAPTVYAPSLWRELQDVLIRYEELLHAGDPVSASRLHARYQELRLDLQQQRSLQLESVQNALPLAAASGMSTLPRDQAAQALEMLWGAPASEQGQRWEQLAGQAAQQGYTRLQLRLAVYELLLRRAQEDPAGSLDRVCELIRLVEDPLSAPPAEIHFLLMLERDLQPRPLPPMLAQVVRLALETRRRAEQAALGAVPTAPFYAPAVIPWIEKTTARGDAARRPGEDLLFADAASWPRARALLEEARGYYQQALSEGAMVARALLVRDEVFGVLPYLNIWIIHLPQDPGATGLGGAQVAREVEGLWGEAHRLQDLLRGRGEDGVTPEHLREQADRVQRGLVALEQRFSQHGKDLLTLDVPDVWRDIANMLVVPFRDPELRMKLLEKGRRVSRRLLEETLKGRPLPEESSAERGAMAQGQARRRGQLVVAMLGPEVFSLTPAQGELESMAQVQRRLEVFAVESRWRHALALAGTQLARRRLLEVEQLVGVVGQVSQVDRGTALRDLGRLAPLAHQIDGAAAASLPEQPVSLLRRLHFQDLLLGQARRTFEDHWAAYQPTAVPYFRVAGLLYLEDAQGLGSWPDFTAQVRKSLTEDSDLRCPVPPPLQLTNEPRAELRLGLEPAPSTPAGFATVWLQGGPMIQLEEPAAGARAAMQVQGERAARVVRCTLTSGRLKEAELDPPPRPTVERTSVTLQCLYRGRQLSTEVSVELLLRPDRSFVECPRPEKASVTVRASAELQEQLGAASGAIAFVLDCSGSMGPPEGESYTATTKYVEATRALRQVLGKVPRGTSVSIWVFGQAVGAEKTTPQPEKTIQRVVPPTVWDPGSATQLREVMAKVEYPALEPWNESPILRALLAARDDLRSVPGLKTIVVLTDGMDNRFDKDPELARLGTTVPAVLRAEFQGSGILVNVVGFKVARGEEEKAWEQLEAVKQLTPPGNLYKVTDGPSLAGVLETAFRQHLRYWVEDYDNQLLPGENARGIPVTSDGSSGSWYPGGLLPGAYQVRSFTTRPVTANIVLGRGDLLPLRLEPTPAGVVLRRFLVTEADYPWRPFSRGGGWRLSVLENRQLLPRAASMLVTLEKEPDPAATTLQEVRPRAVWLDVAPAGSTPFTQRWRQQYGHPAPAWHLEVPEWPLATGGATLAGSALRVWWSPDREVPPAAVLERGNDFQTLADLGGRQVSLPEGAVVLDSVTTETHPVEVEPGRREPRPCLVIRLRHPPGKPFLARTVGAATAGSEQHFYSTQGRSVGLFWPITRDEAERQISRIELVSVDRLRTEAEQRGYQLNLTDLSAPRPGDVGPQPVEIGP